MALQSEKISVSIELDTKQAEKVLEQLKKKISEDNDVDMEKVKERQKEQKKINNDLTKTLLKFEFLKSAMKETARQINAVMTEGRKNLYEYSRLTGGTYSDTLDKVTSAWQALGNSLAVLESTFTMAITPFLSQIIDKGVELVNRLARVVAELFNLPQYYQANGDVVKKWADNIKQTRMLISGLDRLNLFSGTKNTLPENMFYTVENDGKNEGLDSLWSWLQENVGPAWNWIKDKVSSLWDWIKDVFQRFWDWFTKDEYSEYIQRHADGTESFEYYLEKKSPWHQIQDFFVGIWNDLKKWFVGEDPNSGDTGVWQRYVVPWIEDKWKIVKDFLSQEFDKVADAFTNWISSIFKRDDNRLPGVGGRINPNQPMKGIDLAPWLNDYFDSSGRWSPPWKNNANGGVYTKPTLGLIAEYSNASSNPEIVTPQSILDDRLDNSNRNLLGGMASLCQQLISAINNINMSVNIGEETIARAAARGQESYYKQMGRPLIR